MSEYAEPSTTGATQSGSDPTARLRDVLTFPYRSYLYSYPHKTAYRELNPPIPLQSLWEKEDTETYFYICIFLLCCTLRVLQSVHSAGQAAGQS